MFDDEPDDYPTVPKSLSLEELLEQARQEEEQEKLPMLKDDAINGLLEKEPELDDVQELLGVTEQPKKKQRRPIEKLTEEKLLAPTGFLALVQMAKTKRFRHSKVHQVD
jgi:hypothetical protein